MMPSHRCFRGAPVLVLLLAASALGQEKWQEDRTLTVSPRAAPLPLFRYQLFPAAPDRKPGDAAPIYLRFAHERSDQTKKMLVEKPREWNQLPIAKLPIKEVKEFLGGLRYNLNQLELGARRETCDWSYTLDIDDPVGLVISDVQEMRMYLQVLVLKARVEMAEGDHAAATRTLETGYAFSRHITEAPLLINGLVGLAGVSLMTTCVLEMAELPDAPNLYWAMTALPRPLIDLRRAMEFEQRFAERQFPELSDPNRNQVAEEWAAALKRFRAELRRVVTVSGSEVKTEPIDDEKEAAFARKYLTERGGRPAATVKAMSSEQAILVAAALQFREIRDDMFAGTYLTYPEGRPYLDRAEERLKALPDSEGARVARLFLPSVTRVQVALARIERRMAAVRLVEALRLHAAANSGKLPEKLEQLTMVPVPNDPSTGKPFEYKFKDGTATITSLVPGEPLDKGGLRLKVSVRK